MDCGDEIFKELVGLVGIRDKEDETISGYSTEKLWTWEESEEDEGVRKQGFSSGCVRGVGNSVSGDSTKKGKG